MFENPTRGRQARNFATNVSKILDLKSSSEQIFFQKLSLGAPDAVACCCAKFEIGQTFSPVLKGSRFARLHLQEAYV